MINQIALGPSERDYTIAPTSCLAIAWVLTSATGSRRSLAPCSHAAAAESPPDVKTFQSSWRLAARCSQGLQRLGLALNGRAFRCLPQATNRACRTLASLESSFQQLERLMHVHLGAPGSFSTPKSCDEPVRHHT